MTLKVSCPGKINSSLRVGPADTTGYHPIQTKMVAISLVETLFVSRGDSDRFWCDSPEVPIDNTVTKAWRLAREYVELPRLSVTLSKIGMTQGGLGLGSSNAAGFLRALVVLTKGRFRREDAFEVATAVGSDVPFFLVGGVAKAEGHGERVTPLDDEPSRHLIIVKPQVNVSTPEAYRRLDQLPRPWDVSSEWTDWHNDFESVMPDPCAELIRKLQGLGAVRAHLCGSGSAVFGLFPSANSAFDAFKMFEPDSEMKVAICETLTRNESLAIEDVELGALSTL